MMNINARDESTTLVLLANWDERALALWGTTVVGPLVAVPRVARMTVAAEWR